MLGHQDERSHVETLEREVNKRVNFLAAKSVATLGGFEALEADDEDFGHAVDLERLRRLHKLLTLVTVPLVVLIEYL